MYLRKDQYSYVIILLDYLNLKIYLIFTHLKKYQKKSYIDYQD